MGLRHPAMRILLFAFYRVNTPRAYNADHRKDPRIITLLVGENIYFRQVFKVLPNDVRFTLLAYASLNMSICFVYMPRCLVYRVCSALQHTATNVRFTLLAYASLDILSCTGWRRPQVAGQLP